jgi:hypothetical protein
MEKNNMDAILSSFVVVLAISAAVLTWSLIRAEK